MVDRILSIILIVIISGLMIGCTYEDAGAPDNNLWIGNFEYPFEGIAVLQLWTQNSTGDWIRITSNTTAEGGNGGGSGNCLISSGTYTGDNTVNRGIEHGLGVTPDYVRITAYGAYQCFIIHSLSAVCYSQGATTGQMAVTGMDDTYFYVGNAGNYFRSANANPSEYKWVAFGECE